MSYAFAMPILPGKSDAARDFVKNCLGPRKHEYDDMQRRWGVTQESYFFQPSPDGDIVIVTGEGMPGDPATFLDPAGNSFDRYFVDTIQEVTGVNILEIGGETAEHLGTWKP